MTKPKKWHLKEIDGEVTLHYAITGPIRKPNAGVLLGPILNVSLPKREKRGSISEEEAMLVSFNYCTSCNN